MTLVLFAAAPFVLYSLAAVTLVLCFRKGPRAKN
jgi:hypothetical protein